MIRTIVALGIIVISFLVSMRAMSAMHYQDHAKIFLDATACPVHTPKDGICTVEGTLSHRFIDGDMQIILPDGSQWIIPQSAFQGAVIKVSESRYEPFGPIFAFVVGFGIIFLGALLAFGDSMLALLLKRRQIRSATWR